MRSATNVPLPCLRYTQPSRTKSWKERTSVGRDTLNRCNSSASDGIALPGREPALFNFLNDGPLDLLVFGELNDGHGIMNTRVQLVLSSKS